MSLNAARFDVLGILRGAPLEPFGFAGVGIASTTYRSFSPGLPVGIADRGVMFSAGFGARRVLGPIPISAEAKYLIVPDADLNVMQLRFGVGF